MDLRLAGITRLRISRKQLGTGSVSRQPDRYGAQLGKLREARIRVRFPAANVNYPIAHGLRRRPTGWEVTNITNTTGPGGTVYADTPLPADNRVICLKCSTAGTFAEITVR